MVCSWPSYFVDFLRGISPLTILLIPSLIIASGIFNTMAITVRDEPSYMPSRPLHFALQRKCKSCPQEFAIPPVPHSLILSKNSTGESNKVRRSVGQAILVQPHSQSSRVLRGFAEISGKDLKRHHEPRFEAHTDPLFNSESVLQPIRKQIKPRLAALLQVMDATDEERRKEAFKDIEMIRKQIVNNTENQQTMENKTWFHWWPQVPAKCSMQQIHRVPAMPSLTSMMFAPNASDAWTMENNLIWPGVWESQQNFLPHLWFAPAGKKPWYPDVVGYGNGQLWQNLNPTKKLLLPPTDALNTLKHMPKPTPETPAPSSTTDPSKQSRQHSVDEVWKTSWIIEHPITTERPKQLAWTTYQVLPKKTIQWLPENQFVPWKYESGLVMTSTPPTSTENMLMLNSNPTSPPSSAKSTVTECSE